MPSASARRVAKSAIATRSAPAVAEREPRGARRRRETRSRLLEAALELMAEKGMAGVAINEITEAADVGFGSFYNHFESKEAIYAAVVEQVFSDFANAIEAVLGDISDPAEIIAVSTRYTVMRALREPVWGRFLVREGFSPGSLDRGLGRRLLRDLKRGVNANRLTVTDSFMSFATVAGTTLGAISLALQFGSRSAQQAATLRELGSDLEHLPERTAKVVLEALGLTRGEAEKVAYRPLPVLQVPRPGNELESSEDQVIPADRTVQSAAKRSGRGRRRARSE